MNETDNLDSWWNSAEQCEHMCLLEEQAKEVLSQLSSDISHGNVGLTR